MDSMHILDKEQFLDQFCTTFRFIYISCEVLLDNPTITFRGQQKKKRYIEVRDDTRTQKKNHLPKKCEILNSQSEFFH